jgi:hypothetical protein
MGKLAHFMDLSMAKSSKFAVDDGKDAGGLRVGDKGFDDVTDLKNEDFVYVL